MWTIIAHGGASGFTHEELLHIQRTNPNHPILSDVSAEIEKGIKNAILEGIRSVQSGMGVEEVAVSVTVSLENNELFNAGKGSSKTQDGGVEMDAVIMKGDEYGGIISCKNVKNPILLAQHIKKNYHHKVMCDTLEFPRVDDEYFHSDVKETMYQNVRKVRYGTVGCVVSNLETGEMCVCSSTGGSLRKEVGRVGDTPMPGVGSMIGDGGAVSSTGYGEEFMKHCPANRILTVMELTKLPMYDCMKETFDRMRERSGGVIGIDRSGKPQAYMNSNSMHYGWWTGQDVVVEFYRGTK